MARSEPGPDDDRPARAPRPGEAPCIRMSALSEDAFAGAIGAASARAGWFLLEGHPVAPDIVAGAFAAAAGFFSLDSSVRAKAAATADWYRGWIPAPSGRPLDRDSRLFEQYRLQVPAAGQAPNRWPADLPGFRPAIEAYLTAMDALSARLLRGFACALGVAADRFAPWFASPATQLSLFRYPPRPPGAGPAVSSMVPHTDEGPITILAQQHKRGGLEMSDGAGGWIAVPARGDALVVNVGDMMTWWSNGRIAARRHRVRNGAAGERLSIACFVNPAPGTIVAPLPELGPPRFPPVAAGAHLAAFHAKLEGRA